MTDDLLKRLRGGRIDWRSDAEVQLQAADEIDRLRGLLSRASPVINDVLFDDGVHLDREINAELNKPAQDEMFLSEITDQLRIAALFVEAAPQRNNDAETMRLAADEIDRLRAQLDEYDSVVVPSWKREEGDWIAENERLRGLLAQIDKKLVWGMDYAKTSLETKHAMNEASKLARAADQPAQGDAQ